MIAVNCPFGKLYCDGCNYLTSGGCSYDRNQNATIFNAQDAKDYYDRKYQEMMDLPKETLVELLIGTRPI